MLLRSGPEKLSVYTIQKDGERLRVFINKHPSASCLSVRIPYFEALIMGATLFQVEELCNNDEKVMKSLEYCHHLLKEYQFATREEYAEYQSWLAEKKNGKATA